MGKINSRAKGASGEREAAKLLTERGYKAIRGCQHSGGYDAPDIKFEALKGLHIEVKRVQQLNIESALSQSQVDSGDNVPLVLHRRNGDRWKITLDAKDFIDWFIPGFLELFSDVKVRQDKRQQIDGSIQEQKRQTEVPKDMVKEPKRRTKV